MTSYGGWPECPYHAQFGEPAIPGISTIVHYTKRCVHYGSKCLDQTNVHNWLTGEDHPVFIDFFDFNRRNERGNMIGEWHAADPQYDDPEEIWVDCFMRIMAGEDPQPEGESYP